MRVKNGAGFQNNLALFRGRYQVYTHPKFGLIFSKWPRKRGYPSNPTTQYQVEQFTQAIKWVKYPSAGQINTSQDKIPKSPYYQRDILEAAMFGKAVVIVLKSGRVIEGVRDVYIDIQSYLDTIGDEVGVILVRTSAGWIALSAGDDGDVLTSHGSGAQPTWEPIGSTPIGGSGLWADQITIPTVSGLPAYSTWGTTVTVSDVDTGVFVKASSTGYGIYWPSPTPPYKYTVLTAPFPESSSNNCVALGFTDGTKAQSIRTDTTNRLYVQHYSAPNTYVATDKTSTATNYPANTTWLQIEDDGTDVYFRASLDGVSFATLYSVAKSSGYLGSTGYSHVLINGPAANSAFTIMSLSNS